MVLSRRIIGRTVVAASVVAAITTLVSALVYRLGPIFDACVFLGVLGGGVCQMMAAEFQKRERFPSAILLSQGSTLFLLLGSLALVAWPGGGAVLVLAVFLSGFAISGGIAWKYAVSSSVPKAQSEASFPILEALALAGTAGATMVLLNVERLTIPPLLGLAELANFMVLAAVVLGPFRTLQLGVAKTLLPRLANAADPRERRHILRDEGLTVSAVALAGSVALWYITEPLVLLLYDGRFPTSKALILAFLVGGWAKIGGGFANAAVTAVGSSVVVARWNALGWICVGLSFAGAAFGADWALVGLIYGVSLGWAARAALGLVMTVPYLR